MNKKEFLSLSTEDFKRYYLETYLKVSKDQGKTWGYFYISDYSGGEEKEEPSITLYEHPKKKAYRMSVLEFDFDFPTSGLYSNGRETIYFQRRSERQNKKGICDRTVRLIPFLSLFPDIPLKNHRGYISISTENLNSFFINPKEESLKSAKEKLGKKGILSLSLDRNFGISCGIWSKLPTLWYRFVPVGEINKQLILVYSETFLQEVFDKFRNEGFLVELDTNKKETYCHAAKN